MSLRELDFHLDGEAFETVARCLCLSRLVVKVTPDWWRCARCGVQRTGTRLHSDGRTEES